VDVSNISLEPTYQKRARQLVKNQRAEWISEDTIRMKLQYVEGNLMTTESIANSVNSSTNDNPDGSLNIQTPEDNTILELAKRRLAIKKNLLSQVFDYMLILLCFALFVAIQDYELKVIICFIFSFFWGIRLLYRIFKFIRPSFKDGIVEYIKKRNDYQLESEFNRLKKEYINNH
jgi:hypothetical protein